MANLGSRRIAPEEPKENSAVTREDIEIINVRELWDGLEEDEEKEEEEEEEEDCHEQSEEICNNSCSDEALDYEFIVIENYSELEKDEVQVGEGLTGYNPIEYQPHGSSIALVEDNDEQKAMDRGVEQFGGFVFPEIEDEESVFDPDMLGQFEQAMDELSTEEEMLLQQIVESLG
ncbi:hypothetical protein ZIOFF_029107 [Zingiber officinale]|uniref:Uncharacterized protein n=1 Tax=Zingiber officinale TaxID=94328 RepID=A0A8J5GT69_ZINOF|nr:hypothetical protein ZIOFF_029107 [Zingiber officinale]